MVVDIFQLNKDFKARFEYVDYGLGVGSSMLSVILRSCVV